MPTSRAIPCRASALHVILPTALALALALNLAAREPDQNSSPPASPTSARVRQLIEQLDAHNYHHRDQATRELQSLGRLIIPQLKSAQKGTASLEVRRRLGQVLDWYRPRPEWHSNRAAFLKRLQEHVREVNFDDVDTAKSEVVSFAADRYAKTHGVIITGRFGQYAGRTFGMPISKPVSAPNMYLSGTRVRDELVYREEEPWTDVTFTAAGRPAAVAAFAAVFIDVHYPGLGPGYVTVFGQSGQRLGDTHEITYEHTEGRRSVRVCRPAFCGVMAVDGGGNLLPAITRVRLSNGCNWPGASPSAGVTYDDFLFTEPVAAGRE